MTDTGNRNPTPTQEQLEDMEQCLALHGLPFNARVVRVSLDNMYAWKLHLGYDVTPMEYVRHIEPLFRPTDWDEEE